MRNRRSRVHRNRNTRRSQRTIEESIINRPAVMIDVEYSAPSEFYSAIEKLANAQFSDAIELTDEEKVWVEKINRMVSGTSGRTAFADGPYLIVDAEDY